MHMWQAYNAYAFLAVSHTCGLSHMQSPCCQQRIVSAVRVAWGNTVPLCSTVGVPPTSVIPQSYMQWLIHYTTTAEIHCKWQAQTDNHPPVLLSANLLYTPHALVS